MEFPVTKIEGPWTRMARGIHGLSKVSPRPTQLNLSTPCGQATPETALLPFRGWRARRVGGLRPFSTPLDTPRRTGLMDLPDTPCDLRLPSLLETFLVILRHDFIDISGVWLRVSMGQ
jgi:hypothetical protein